MQQRNHTQWVQSQGVRSCLSIRKLFSLLFGVMVLVIGVLPGEVEAYPIWIPQGLWDTEANAIRACGDHFKCGATQIGSICGGSFAIPQKRAGSHSHGGNNTNSPTMHTFPYCPGGCPSNRMTGSTGRCCPEGRLTDPNTGLCARDLPDCNGLGFDPDTFQCLCPTGFTLDPDFNLCVEENCDVESCRPAFDAKEADIKQVFEDEVEGAVTSGGSSREIGGDVFFSGVRAFLRQSFNRGELKQCIESQTTCIVVDPGFK